MNRRVTTVVGVGLGVAMTIALLSLNFTYNPLAEAQHIKRYHFDGNGVVAVPYGKLEQSEISFSLRTNDKIMEEGNVTLGIDGGFFIVDHGQTTTTYRFVSGTWIGEIASDGSYWETSGMVKDSLGKVYSLELRGSRVQTTSAGELYAVEGAFKNAEIEYSLHHYGTIDVLA